MTNNAAIVLLKQSRLRTHFAGSKSNAEYSIGYHENATRWKATATTSTTAE